MWTRPLNVPGAFATTVRSLCVRTVWAAKGVRCALMTATSAFVHKTPCKSGCVVSGMHRQRVCILVAIEAQQAELHRVKEGVPSGYPISFWLPVLAKIGYWAICIGFPIQKRAYLRLLSSTSSELQNCASLERPPPGIGAVQVQCVQSTFATSFTPSSAPILYG